MIALMKLFLLVAFITAAGIVGYYYQNELLALVQENPEMTFQKNFENNPLEVKNLQGGRADILKGDNWIRFTSTKKIVLKKENTYKLIECKAPSEWFMLHTKDFDNLRNLQDLICLQLHDNGNNWYVQNTKTNTYFFRNW